MSYIAGLKSRIEAAEAEARKGCGQSDVLYESRVSAFYEAILKEAPEVYKSEVELALMERGHFPDERLFCGDEWEDIGEDECRMTGIRTHCCPCGNHE